MTSRLGRPNDATLFSWRQLSKNYYHLLAGSDIYGSLQFSAEPSVLFAPAQCEFYRATAQAGDQTYFFKCLFMDGEFCGCVGVEEGAPEPIVMFEHRPSDSIWRSRSRIVLCEDGTAWPWLYGAATGQWVVLGKPNGILSLKSLEPEQNGTVRVDSPPLMKRSEAPALILFSVYLAIGPKRAVSVAA